MVTDVRNLLGDDATLNEVAPYAFHEYNTDQMIIVENEGRKVRFACSFLTYWLISGSRQ